MTKKEKESLYIDISSDDPQFNPVAHASLDLCSTFSIYFVYVLSSSSWSPFRRRRDDTTIHPLNMQMQKQETLATEKKAAESARNGNLSWVVCGGENGAGGDGDL